MNHDDESFLSAFIDGELGPDQQQRLESAIVSNPHLAERLRGLTQVRDLVAGLPHDGSIDVTESVMRRIRSRGRQHGLFPTLEGWRRGSRRILPLAGLAAGAASLMVAASLAILMQASRIEKTGRAIAHVAQPAGALVSSPTARREAEEGSGKATALTAIPTSSPPEIATSLAQKALGAAAGALATATEAGGVVAHELVSNSDLSAVRQFIDSASLKRFFWVRGGGQRGSEQVVASIVEHTTHFEILQDHRCPGDRHRSAAPGRSNGAGLRSRPESA